MSDALALMLALHRAPALGAHLRMRELPADVLQVIRIAAGDERAAEEAASMTGLGRPELHEAAVLYLQQVLFCEDADSYRTLGVAPDADAGRLKEHHRWLIHWLHPDRDGGDGLSVFAERINRAWNDLRTQDRRQLYDRQRSDHQAAAVVARATALKTPTVRAHVLDAADPLLSGRIVRRLPQLVLGVFAGVAVLLVGLLLVLHEDDEPHPGPTAVAKEPAAAAGVRSDAADAVSAARLPPAAGNDTMPIAFADTGNSMPHPHVVPALRHAQDGPGSARAGTQRLGGAQAPIPEAGGLSAPSPPVETDADTRLPEPSAAGRDPAPAVLNPVAVTRTAANAAPDTSAWATAPAIAQPITPASGTSAPAGSVEAGSGGHADTVAVARRNAPAAPAPSASKAVVARRSSAAPASHRAAPTGAGVPRTSRKRAPARALAATARPSAVTPALPAPMPSRVESTPKPPPPAMLPTAAQAQSTIERMQRAYRTGDLGRLMNLFVAQPSGRSREALAREYGDLFAGSREHALVLRDLAWLADGETVVGLGRFKARVVPHRGGREQLSEGGVRVELRMEHGEARIVRLTHDRVAQQ